MLNENAIIIEMLSMKCKDLTYAWLAEMQNANTLFWQLGWRFYPKCSHTAGLKDNGASSNISLVIGILTVHWIATLRGMGWWKRRESPACTQQQQQQLFFPCGTKNCSSHVQIRPWFVYWTVHFNSSVLDP